VIVSIPHTGSRFLSARLAIDEIVHTELSWSELIKKTAGKVLVSPLRRPEDVLKSAVRRTPPELPLDVAGWFHCWYMMHALTLIRNIDFIVLEDMEDPRIFDWSPVGKDDKGSLAPDGRPMYHDRPVPPLPLDKIHELPFVRARYG
jgi:hypothetical protein